MAASSGEIILRDLIAWEPRLQLVAANGTATATASADDDPLDRDVDWVITARASAPMLPAMRGNELILLPKRVVAESGVQFPMLANELALQPVAGLVTDIEIAAPPRIPLPVLRVPAITADLESELNRLLTAHRGDLLRTGADVERAIAELNGREARPGELIDALARQLDLAITITVASGAVAFTTSRGGPVGPPVGAGTPENGDELWLREPLRGGRTLWIGPIAAARHALGRLIIRRLRDGIQRALDRDDAAAPRGSARIQALNELLQPAAASNPDRLVAQAMRAGLPPGTQLRVVLHPPDETDQVIRRRLAALGTIHDAGNLDNLTAQIVTIGDRPESGAGTRAPFSSDAPTSTLWLAVSAAIASARELPEATRQARYIAGLFRRGLLTGPEARFDDDARLGAYWLLFDRWGSDDLRRYVDLLIGELLREDRRGLLRETLRVYLEHGGAQRPTAERLSIHRNTLSYRLRQIRTVLHVDPDDPGARLGLHLALLAAELPPPPAST